VFQLLDPALFCRCKVIEVVTSEDKVNRHITTVIHPGDTIIEKYKYRYGAHDNEKHSTMV